MSVNNKEQLFCFLIGFFGECTDLSDSDRQTAACQQRHAWSLHVMVLLGHEQARMCVVLDCQCHASDVNDIKLRYSACICLFYANFICFLDLQRSFVPVNFIKVDFFLLHTTCICVLESVLAYPPCMHNIINIYIMKGRKSIIGFLY